MGGTSSKVVPLPVPTIIKKLSECIIPDNRNVILDLFEMVDIVLCNGADKDAAFKQFKESNGIQVMMKIFKKMVEDQDLVYLTIQLFETIQYDHAVVMDVIQYGGMDVLDRALKLHRSNEFVSLSLPKIIKEFLGAPTSIIEIQNETMNLQFCRTCQEILERNKQKQGVSQVTMIVIPKPSERIIRVLKFMDNFIKSPNVVVAALDAVISFVRNADAPSSINDTPLISLVYEALKSNIERQEIVWRACLAFSVVSGFHSDLAHEIANVGIADILIDAYPKFKNDKFAQQQILWLFASLLKFASSQKIIHKNQRCMDFFKQVISDFDVLKEKFLNNPLAQKKGFKDDKLYEVVTPLQITSFMRETGGEKYKEKKNRVGTNQNFKPRRNFDEKPRFGTIEDRIFSKGEEGLLSKPGDDDNKASKLADWEVALGGMAKRAIRG